ncbi:hypothetical protein [Flavobacterium sp. UBA6135]|uniref:hypothetical protein n=1 Tax=Flavobacterium sp. UBA6135 TaxID=1946553 RepID=UPI0025BDC43B|nr:hypothetical protein [Flavobacterium sp. UBA6135]
MAKGEKTGGRSKGTPNRTTAEIRELFQKLIDENLDTISNDLKELKPEQRLKFIIEFSKFVIPTLKATEMTYEEKVIIDFTEVEVSIN